MCLCACVWFWFLPSLVGRQEVFRFCGFVVLVVLPPPPAAPPTLLPLSRFFFAPFETQDKVKDNDVPPTATGTPSSLPKSTPNRTSCSAMETPARYIPKQRIGPFVESVFMGPESDDTRSGVQINASTPSSLLARGSYGIGHVRQMGQPKPHTHHTHQWSFVFFFPLQTENLLATWTRGASSPLGDLTDGPKEVSEPQGYHAYNMPMALSFY